jgi:hypothetical protein
MLDATWLCNEQKVDQRGLLERESHTRGRAPEDFAKAPRQGPGSENLTFPLGTYCGGDFC